MQAGLDRLRRAADYAAHRSVLLLLENLNKEPPDAEVHYLAHTIDEWRWFYERLGSPALQLSFTANHAHLVPEGVQGFIDRTGNAWPTAACPRSPPRRLFSPRPRGTPEPRPRRLRFSVAIRSSGGKRLHRPLHERLRLARRHAEGPCAVCPNGDGLTRSAGQETNSLS